MDRRNALLAWAERLAQMGSWEWLLDRDELIWSDNMFRLYGLEPGELTPSPEYAVERTHPDDRDYLAQAIRAARNHGALPPLAYRIVLPDGEVRHLRVTVAWAEPDERAQRRLLGAAQDVTDRRRAEAEIGAHVAVANALTGWESFETSGRRLLECLGKAMDFELGVLWIVRDNRLVPGLVWKGGPLRAREFNGVTSDLRLEDRTALPVQAWREREPVNVASLLDAAPSARRDSALRSGLVGAVALPALNREEVLAVFEFHSRDQAPLGERLMDSLTGIGYEIGQFLSRRRGELAPSPLTQREQQILQLAAQGNSGRRISELLVISPATVKTHFEHIYAKWGVSDRAAAVARGIREGLID